MPVNGSLVGLYLTTFPNSLTFACDPGFILKGSRVRHCEASAVWSGNETFCQGTFTGIMSVTKIVILINKQERERERCVVNFRDENLCEG